MLLHSTKKYTATQSGQLSVEVNDEVDLISDTHWYWWFVRKCDDGGEGFVPAEILELPCERLARFNRQNNIRISLEPSKKAIIVRKHPKKSVRFSDTLTEHSICLAIGDNLNLSVNFSDSDSAISLVSPASPVVTSEVPCSQEEKQIEDQCVRIHNNTFNGLRERLTAQAL